MTHRYLPGHLTSPETILFGRDGVETTFETFQLPGKRCFGQSERSVVPVDRLPSCPFGETAQVVVARSLAKVRSSEAARPALAVLPAAGTYLMLLRSI